MKIKKITIIRNGIIFTSLIIYTNLLIYLLYY